MMPTGDFPTYSKASTTDRAVPMAEWTKTICRQRDEIAELRRLLAAEREIHRQYRENMNEKLRSAIELKNSYARELAKLKGGADGAESTPDSGSRERAVAPSLGQDWHDTDHRLGCKAWA